MPLTSAAPRGIITQPANFLQRRHVHRIARPPRNRRPLTSCGCNFPLFGNNVIAAKEMLDSSHQARRFSTSHHTVIHTRLGSPFICIVCTKFNCEVYRNAIFGRYSATCPSGQLFSWPLRLTQVHSNFIRISYVTENENNWLPVVDNYRLAFQVSCWNWVVAFISKWIEWQTMPFSPCLVIYCCYHQVQHSVMIVAGSYRSARCMFYYLLKGRTVSGFSLVTVLL